MDQPGKDLAQYKYQLKKARRRAIRARLEGLAGEIDRLLPMVTTGIFRGSRDQVTGVETQQIQDHIAEIERLLGDTSTRAGRWGDLYRHMSFSEGHDWWDILEYDWPSVKPDTLSAALADSDPITVPDIDLGSASAGELSGGVATALRWENLTDDGFERLLFELLRGLTNYDSAEWLMKTNAADHGRDLSVFRTLNDATGLGRRERVIVQAKHWQSKSVDPGSINDALSRLAAWEPPHIHYLVIASSGRFTPDAVRFVEAHNEKGSDPRIEMWPDPLLEAMLVRRPELTAGYGLRS